MAINKLNTATPNNELGLYFTKGRPITVNQSFGEMALWIKASTGGVVVCYNSSINEYVVWELESGETAPIACDIILSSAVIDGNPYTTTATGMYWATSSSQIGDGTSNV